MSKKTPLVLVVDDEAAERQKIAEVLAERGFPVLMAADYLEAIDAFEKHADEIGLALLDVALPGKNGVDIAKAILSRRPDMRILFISGHVGASVIRFHGVEANDAHFLQKPFDRATLKRRIDEALCSTDRLSRTLSAGIASDRD